MWYSEFPKLSEKIVELKSEFERICNDLGVDRYKVLEEFGKELTTRIVHESNWQEGLILEKGKTKKFTELAINKIEDIAGPSLDVNWILEQHRVTVAELFEGGASTEEVGAYNLASAHMAIVMIQTDIYRHNTAFLVKQMQNLLHEGKDILPEESLKLLHKSISESQEDQERSVMKLRGSAETIGQSFSELLKLEIQDLKYSMNVSYIHFLHSMVMMGIMEPSKLGRFREGPVHVGNPDLLFPPVSTVPVLMKKFCLEFPAMPSSDSGDLILTAAKVSHRFVHIHPYEDGNGRVSRLLMNLFLQLYHPPVFLKADRKGRHRYASALKRADRGQFEPLASLIAISLIEIYQKLIALLSR